VRLEQLRSQLHIVLVVIWYAEHWLIDLTDQMTRESYDFDIAYGTEMKFRWVEDNTSINMQTRNDVNIHSRNTNRRSTKTKRAPVADNALTMHG
jgi:hypothetical protein